MNPIRFGMLQPSDSSEPDRDRGPERRFVPLHGGTNPRSRCSNTRHGARLRDPPSSHYIHTNVITPPSSLDTASTAILQTHSSTYTVVLMCFIYYNFYYTFGLLLVDLSADAFYTAYRAPIRELHALSQLYSGMLAPVSLQQRVHAY